MQHTVTVQTRGRVTIPTAIRDALHLRQGDELLFVEEAPGKFELKVEPKRAALLGRRRSSRISMTPPTRSPQLELNLGAVEGSRPIRPRSA
ncbi:hypothetical protein WDL1P1_00491 (plasmid) [Variovorax sp. WDL1]|uniref:AbrB/MazE/SpoVT family DNA-binding domain-containing protein n=1 Tax=Variovorax sp. WDL1 TaxID=207745 RepID=UPI00083959FE|nr:hypothetical protein CHC06_06059 [Variovorax sp. B2]PNG51308.1 hypothetical protein CHC07_05965 [Variovorax sp. B4]VTV17567.1 hypothetical protein WDL1P1_00491 [Variovorax sp. WDL1]